MILQIPVFIWLCGSFYILYWVFKKGKDKSWYYSRPNRILLKSLALSHLFSPTIVGGWSWALPLPATFTIYACTIWILAEPFGFKIFRMKDLLKFLTLSSVMFAITFVLFFLIGFAFSILNDYRKTRKTKNIKTTEHLGCIGFGPLGGPHQ